MKKGQKLAVVTGGSGGIGSAVARRLSRESDTRVVIADRDAEGASRVAKELGCSWVAVDLGNRDECLGLIPRVEKDDGPVDILINNAGFQHVAPIEEFPVEEWDRLIGVMLTAPFLLTRAVWSGMKKSQWGRIVNMASIHAKVASPCKAGYVSAKHGLLGLTRVAALEGGAFGITVNAICPAYVKTPLVESQLSDQATHLGLSPQEVVEKVMLEPAAVKRLIDPAEVADLVAYLCSEKASSVTGAAWTMDLGWTAR